MSPAKPKLQGETVNKALIGLATVIVAGFGVKIIQSNEKAIESNDSLRMAVTMLLVERQQQVKEFDSFKTIVGEHIREQKEINSQVRSLQEEDRALINYLAGQVGILPDRVNLRLKHKKD